MARSYMYVSCWGLTPAMRLVRGMDQRAGPDGSPEQEQLVAELRADGLGEDELDFWGSHELTVQAVLAYAVSKGVEVKALLWPSPKLLAQYDPQAALE
jgi:hypothetical protein